MQVYADQGVYTGAFNDDMPEGLGQYRGVDGSAYAGEWVSGMRRGQGLYDSAGGDRYIGGFIADQFDGEGAGVGQYIQVSSNGRIRIAYVKMAFPRKIACSGPGRPSKASVAARVSSQCKATHDVSSRAQAGVL